MSNRSLALVPLLIGALLSLTLFSLTFASAPQLDTALEGAGARETDPLGLFETEEIVAGDFRFNGLAASLITPLGGITMYEIEPNNTYTTANPLPGTQAVVSGNIYPVGDLDYFSFSGNAGDRVYAATMTSIAAGATDSTLTLFDTDGTTIIEVDVNDGSFAASSSSIAGATLPASGTYYLQVRTTSATSSMRPYNLYFKLQSGAPTAETEPNNLGVGGQPLPSSGWVTGTISPAADNDVFVFAMNAGDTVFLSLDLDPERDGGTTWNGRIGLGAFGDPPLILVVNDPNVTSPNSEAFFFTVKESGSYYAYVDHPTALGDPAFTYHLSVSIFPHVPATASCTTYTSADVPLVIPTGPALVESSLTVPGNPIIADLDVSITLTHTNMPDLDVVLMAPGGNQVVLFNDLGSNTQQQMNLTLDDEAAIPMGSYTAMSGMVYKPPASRRLDWFDNQNAGGVWTLQVYDDLANNGGVLQSWSLTICEPPPPPSCPVGYEPVTVFSSDFEANDGGFTTTGTTIDWAWGTPTFAPLNSCNSGDNCWVTNLSGNYSPSTNQNLLSPAIDLNGLSGPVIIHWAQKYQIENATWDNAFVQVQEVGGANPTRLWEWLGPTMSNLGVGSPATTIPMSAGWSERWADISGYAGQSVEALFNLSSDPSVHFAGLAVDDVYVTACQLAAPEISLTKTVGTNPSICAATAAITVPEGTEVTYCYTVENTGNVTLELHDLDDSELGGILAGHNFALTPGSSVFLTQTAIISDTTVNTAMWTAYNLGPTDVVTATAAATVTIGIPEPPNIVVDPLSLSSVQDPDTQTQHTLTISNTGGSDLTWTILEEPTTKSAARPLFPSSAPYFDSEAALEAELSGVELMGPLPSIQASPEARALAKRALMTTGILLVPDSSNDRIMALDPITGDVIDPDFVPSNAVVGTGVHAILSASGDSILLSDQTGDVVREFDLDGNYLGIFAPAGGANTAIIDNIRGISLDANGNLLVTVGSGANVDSIAMFDTAGNYLGNFIANGAGGLDNPFDIYGRSSDWLVSAIDSDAIHRYDLTGAYIANLASVNTFPQQIAEAANSNVLVANFSPAADEGVIEFTSTGVFVGRYDPVGLGGYRGVYELPNGNILTTTGGGVYEIDRNGNLVQTKIGGISGRFIEYVVLQTDCANPADIPWATVAPTNGTTAPGGATEITVTLDSTGLTPGDYSGNLCIFSDDPDPGPGNETELVIVPVNLTVSQILFASIELTKTVGLNPAECATSDEITVDRGEEVYYCYEVTNTGDVPLSLHDLVDDQLGTIFTGLAYNLLPGESVNTVSAGLTISQTIHFTTTNTAEWTAYDNVFYTASATASATVNVLMPDIHVDPLSLSSAQIANSVTMQTLTIANIGQGALTWEIVETLPDLAPRSGVQAAPEPVFDVPAAVTSAADCAVFENYPGREPEGWAEFCGQPEMVAAAANHLRVPSSTGYTLNLRTPNRNLYQFILNDFPGQTVVGPQADNIYALDFDASATTIYALNSTPVPNQLGTLSVTTGAFTPIVDCSAPDAGTWTGLSIDPVSNVFYASTAANLYLIDPVTCSPTLIGPFGVSGGIMIDIAIGPAGVMYGHDIFTDAIYTIDTTTGAATLVGPTGYNANFAQGMDFDNEDGVLYIFLYIGTGVNHYGTVNLATGAVTPLASTNPSGEFEGATQTVSACNPADHGWLSVNPATGVTAPGEASSVEVTFDSTGLSAGVYNGQLCIRSNDPDAGPGNGTDVVVVPVTLTVTELAPALDLTVTLSVDNSCGATNALEVEPGTAVYYCYTVENTGDVMLSTHTITETAFGDIASFPFDLLPGATASIIVSQTIAADTASTARWTAARPDLGLSAMAEAMTSVTVNFVYDLALSPASAAQTAAPGETVSYALTITNEGNTADTVSFTAAGHTWLVGLPDPVMLDAGESAVVMVTVTIPGTAANGDNDTVTITAVSGGDPGVTASSALTTTAEVATVEFTLYLPVLFKP
jgi:subtilisin-like proprotein convertase family protein